jgi:DNA-binding transcriptional MocR family regulator
MVEILGSEAGMHLTVVLRRPSRDFEIANRAAAQNLWIWPLSSSFMNEPSRSGFILGFGSTPVEEIPAAVIRFRDLLMNKA